MPIKQAEANRLLEASFGKTAFVAPTAPILVELTTTTPTATANGTPVAGGSYAAQAVTMNAAATGSINNNGALTYTNMPATTVNGLDVKDSAGTPRYTWGGALTAPKTTNAGDIFTIAATTGLVASIT